MIKDFGVLGNFSHDIHCLYKGSAKEGKDERQVLEMGGNGYDQGGGGGEK
jgi:hypothetical protein